MAKLKVSNSQPEHSYQCTDFGTVVGYVFPPDGSIENGFVVTKNGGYREFSVPWAAYTEARGITGTVFFKGPGSAGFI